MTTPYDAAWQLATLRTSVNAWNTWREEHPEVDVELSQTGLADAGLLRRVDLSYVNLSRANLSSMHLSQLDLTHANLSHANLSGAVFYGVNLTQANLTQANLIGAELTKSELTQVNLTQAQLRNMVVRITGFREALLREADLSGAQMEDISLFGADLRGAVLRGTNLRGALLQETNCIGADFSDATLSDCYIYGMSSGDVQLDDTRQLNLCITPPGLPEITVDGLNAAQQVSAFLDNADIPTTTDWITRNVVLILGRFLGERHQVLDAHRKALRRRGYRPVACNFRKLSDQRYGEGITMLARMACFIVADLTHPGGTSTVDALDAILPTVIVPVQPLIELGSRSWETYKDYSWPYPWVLPMQTYDSQSASLGDIVATLIVPAEVKAEELKGR